MHHLIKIIVTCFLLVSSGYTKNDQPPPDITKQLIGWAYQSNSDSLQLFLFETPFRLYDQFRSLLSHHAQAVVEGDSNSIDELTHTVNWILNKTQQSEINFSFLRRAWQRNRQIGVTEAEAKIKADSLFKMSKLVKDSSKETAQQLIEQALTGYIQIRDSLNIVPVLDEISSQTLDINSTIKNYQNTLKQASLIGDKTIAATSVFNLAESYRKKQKFNLALEKFSESAKLFEQLKYKALLAQALSRQAILTAIRVGDPQKAQYLRTKALLAATESGDLELQCILFHNIAAYYQNHGNYRESLRYHLEADSLARAINFWYIESYSQAGLANLFYDLYLLNEGFEYARNSLKIIKKEFGDLESYIHSKNTDGRVLRAYTNSLNLIAKGHILRGNLPPVKELFDKATSISKRLGDTRGMIQSYIYRALSLRYSQPEIALALLEKALAISVAPVDKHDILLLLSKIYNDLQRQQSIEIAKELLILARTSENNDLIWQALLVLTEANLRTGDHTKAYQYSMEALTVLEKTRNPFSGLTVIGNFLGREDISRLHHLAIELELRQGKIENAYNIARNLKARLLSEKSRLNDILLGSVEKEKSLQQLDKSMLILRDMLAKSQKQNDKMRYQNELIRLEIDRKDLLLKAKNENTFISSQGLPLSAVQNILEQKQATLIDFVITKETIYIFVTTGSAIQVAKANLPIDSLRNVIGKLLPFQIKEGNQGVSANLLAFDMAASKSLYEMLIAPILPLTQKYPNWIIVPDGWLAYLPFEILLKTQNSNWQLLKDHTIRYLPSVSFLFSGEEDREPPFELVAFANPSLRHFEKKESSYLQNFSSILRGNADSLVITLPPLKHAEREVEAITEIFPTSMYVGSNATEAEFKKQASKATIVHLATHAIIDHERPELSKLIFSNENIENDDGLLHAYELESLHLEAELLVLSACQTAVGKLTQTEGLTSLANSFFQAGAKALVATLWPVDDRATAQIMAAFYRFLGEGFNKDEALQRAKLQYLNTAPESKRHPYYWAGFILLGSNDAFISEKTFSQSTLLLFTSIFVLSSISIFLFVRIRSKI